jgi:CAP-Gly domain-containing linker protein 1
VLESENTLLMSEIEQLCQEVKILEDNLDQSIMQEEENLNLDKIGKDGSDDGSKIEQLKKILKEQVEV